MFRSAAPRLAMAMLIGAAAVPLTASVAGAADPDPVVVGDFFFQPASREVVAGDTVTWELDPAATDTHAIAIDANNDGTIDQQELALAQDLAPGAPFTWRFDTADPQDPYDYVCRYHPIQMRGTVLVKNGPPPSSSTTTTTAPTTTTTTEPPTTTTTTEPPTTTTTRPADTTTTTRPRATTTTRPDTTTTTRPSQSSGTPTTSSTARATTTTGKATTSTTAKTKKAKPSTSTTEPETTTTSDGTIFEAEWIPRPDNVPDGEATTTTGSDEAAAGGSDDGGSGSGGLPVAPLAGALAVALLGAGGWAWHHRSSRYLSA